jgi:phage terminase large subunit-like protein
MFNDKLADDVIRFFSRRLTHTKGIYAGRPFIPIPWQEELLRDVFGTVKTNGFRQYTTAYVEMGKKNGKSELGAGIGLAGLFLDNESGAEIYSVARTRNQAGNVFRVAAQMVRNDPLLMAESRIVDSTKTIYLRHDPSSYFKILSADADIEDGCNPHMVIFDELHRQTNRDLWDVFKFGKGTRAQPLLFAITTAGVSGRSPICEQQHDYARRLLQGTFQDPTFYPAIYSIDEQEDWTYQGEPEHDGKPATGWYRANPALGYFLSLETLREDFKTALEMPAEQNSFRRFRLSQWVSQETRAIPMDKWNACGQGFSVAELAGKECFGGLDLSTTKDLTAFVLVFPQDGKYLWLPFLFLPEDDLQKRSRKDNVPYDLWAKQGFIFLTPGNEVDYGFVRKKINDCAEIYNIREIGYDAWNATSIVHDLMGDGMTMVPIRQGFGSLNAPTGEVLSMIKSGRLVHNNNPCLNWMADCLSLKQDPAGNIKPTKPDRNKTSKRIDGIAAGINATARILVSQAFKEESVYDTRGPRIAGGSEARA